MDTGMGRMPCEGEDLHLQAKTEVWNRLYLQSLEGTNPVNTLIQTSGLQNREADNAFVLL